MSDTIGMSPSLYSMMVFVEERGGEWEVQYGAFLGFPAATALAIRINDFAKTFITEGKATNLHDSFESNVRPILAAYRDLHPRPNECPKCWRQLERLELFTSVETFCLECQERPF